MTPASPARSPILVAAAVALVVVIAVGVGLLYGTGRLNGGGTGSSTMQTTVASSTYPTSSSTSYYSTTSTSSTVSTASTASVIMPNGTTYVVQSSFDCLAGHYSLPFNVTVTSILEGGISAGSPGVTLYVSTAQEAQTTNDGHPTVWVYTSGLTNSTSFSVPLAPGSYVLWTEGSDQGCGQSIVEPLEALTTVTVTQAVNVQPG